MFDVNYNLLFSSFQKYFWFQMAMDHNQIFSQLKIIRICCQRKSELNIPLFSNNNVYFSTSYIQFCSRHFFFNLYNLSWKVNASITYFLISYSGYSDPPLLQNNWLNRLTQGSPLRSSPLGSWDEMSGTKLNVCKKWFYLSMYLNLNSKTKQLRINIIVKSVFETYLLMTSLTFLILLSFIQSGIIYYLLRECSFFNLAYYHVLR